MKIDRDPQTAKQVPLDIETMALSTRPLEPELVSPIIDHDPVSAGQPERTLRAFLRSVATGAGRWNGDALRSLAGRASHHR